MSVAGAACVAMMTDNDDRFRMQKITYRPRLCAKQAQRSADPIVAICSKQGLYRVITQHLYVYD